MSNASDFIIENGVLKKYKGPGGDVVIPGGVKEIGMFAFYECTNLTSVTIPDSVTQIDRDAFGPSIFGPSIKICIKNLSVLPADLREPTVFAFLKDGGDPTDLRSDSCFKYIKKHAEKLIPELIAEPDLLAIVCREKLIPAKSVNTFMEVAQAFQKADAIALLLDYNANQLSKTEKMRVEKQKEIAEDTVFERRMMRQEKIGIDGLIFVAGGTLETFEKRSELKAFIESKGGSLASVLTAKVDYLITNGGKVDAEKKKKAAGLRIECISERRFNEMADRCFLIENGILVRYLGVGGDVVIPDCVKEIGEEAFRGCQTLKSVAIPDSVKRIDALAFWRCENLTSITIPDSVTEIGRSAFYECKNLTSVTIPDGVTEIGEAAFKGCKNLTSVTIPDGVTEIGEAAFWGCENLTSVTIPDSVTEIGMQAFEGCKNLTSVTIPDGVTEISRGAFYECKNLTSVTIPDSVTEIDYYAFYGCGKLTSVAIPDGVTKIGDYAFDTSVKICIKNLSVLPADLCEPIVFAFLKDGGDPADLRSDSCFKYIKNHAEKLMPKLIAEPDLLAIVCREKLIPAKSVNAFMEAAQASQKADTIALLLDYNANQLSKTEKMRVEKQKEIADMVFERRLIRQDKIGIDGLVFVISGSLETFKNRTALKDFIESKGGKLASGLTAKVDYLITNSDVVDREKKKKAAELGVDCISERRFNELADRSFQIENEVLVQYVSTDGDVVIPDCVKEIGVEAFYGRENLTSVAIPAGVTKIGRASFAGCEKLTSVIIPDSMMKIGVFAFCNCTNLSSVTLPDSVTEIGDYAFDGASTLKIHAPAGSYAETYAKEHNIPFVAE